MGNVFRKRRQVTEELEEIVTEIKELETQIKEYGKSRSNFLCILIYAMLTLLVGAVSYTWMRYRVMFHRVAALTILMILAIILFIVLRLALISTYEYLIQRKRKRIQIFMERKSTIIEDVKENEKFKVAKEIIEKYSSKEDLINLMKTDLLVTDKNQKNTSLSYCKLFDTKTETELLPASNSKQALIVPTVKPDTQQSKVLSFAKTPLNTLPKLHEIGDANFSRTPIRPFVQPSSNPIDRILDFVMGESINNRYALICFQCRAHNGMVLHEELELIAYFCFKCGTYNPSRNEKKAAQLIVLKSQQQNRNTFLPFCSSSTLINDFNELTMELSNSAAQLHYEGCDQRTRTPSISSFSAIVNDVEVENSKDLSAENSDASSKNSSVNSKNLQRNESTEKF